MDRLWDYVETYNKNLDMVWVPDRHKELVCHLEHSNDLFINKE